MTLLVKSFLSDRSGATAIEYAMVAAGIAMAIVATLTIAGSNVGNLYTSIASVV